MAYDVIIVGAGSAGCVLAARLSEDPRRSVLLLEAGPDYPTAAQLPPEVSSSLLPAFTHDWGYFGEPDALGRTVHLARGKLVGGCSATNATVALRGAPADYDEWHERGNRGWSFTSVLPSFQRLESDADFHDPWHGQNGPIRIRRFRREELTPVQGAFLDSCAALGYREVSDHNEPGACGAGPAPMNAIDGVRQSAAVTYLPMARGRPNLTIRSGAQVDRLVMGGRRVTGLWLADGETVSADRTILSAGTYGSPAILLRSGLGPADHLEELRIRVVADLGGVGLNLVDHPLLGIRFAASLPSGSAPGFQTVLTMKSHQAADAPDLQILPLSTLPADDSPSGAAFSLLVSVIKPLSRGRLRLRSVDPAAAPSIDLGYFSHPGDMPRMIEVARIARRLARSTPLSDLSLQEMYPGSSVSDDGAELEMAVRSQVETYHHPVGTCAMGGASNPLAVVDESGEVYGIDGLSVVDASIMPTIPSANTNVPTMMLAEHCAALITRQH